ncbi:MAG: hypothetical protein IPO06_25625 [Leptospiraceae bacterium]|nr:hypothetical protein [Leptospiraceae bacterium]
MESTKKMETLHERLRITKQIISEIQEDLKEGKKNGNQRKLPKLLALTEN